MGQGETRDIHTKSAEVYSIKTYKWTKLPGMPQFASKISCARLGDKILISSKEFLLMSFDTKSKTYNLPRKHLPITDDFLD